MTAIAAFEMDRAHEAHEPPEARGLARDSVRLMVSRREDPPESTVFSALPSMLEPGDVVVVNTSGTVPAAIDATLPDGRAIVVHVSTELPGGLWMVEPRSPLPGGATAPLTIDPVPTSVTLSGGVVIGLLRPAPSSNRLWLATVDDRVDVVSLLQSRGRAIRYPYVERDWPIEHYQTVFAAEPGSAEMPSAARPFTTTTVADLVTRGITIVPLTLHTGVSSLEGHETPYPERYRVPASTAAHVNAARAGGGHVIAVGTTVVRALESVADAAGVVHPGSGWTDVVITPERGVRAVDGLITGWHDPDASHLLLVESVAGEVLTQRAYDEAVAHRYAWHEFGDSGLFLPERR